MYAVTATLAQGAEVPARPGSAVSVVRPDPRTGRLVRSVVRVHPQPAARPAKAPASGPLTETVARIAAQNQLSPRLIHSVIQAESNYDPYAVSPKGAQGLMQLIPSTARRFGVSDVFDPVDNIQGGARYLKYLLELYKGDDALALAAYNAGEGAVARYGGIPPFPETQNYVNKVRRRLGEGGTLRETQQSRSAVQPDSAEPAAGPARTYNPIREVKDANGKIYYVSP